MNLIKEFFSGCMVTFTGINEFFKNSHYLKYAIIPLAIIIFFYILVATGIYVYIVPLISSMWDDGNCHPCGKGIANVAIIIFLATITAFLFITILSTLYEMVGGLLFDQLSAEFEKIKYNSELPKLTLKNNLKFLIDSIKYGLITLILFFILLLFSWIIPIVGQLLLIAILGYRFGVSCLMGVLVNNNIPISKLKTVTTSDKAYLLGFGVTGYLLMLIPFLPIIILPGLVVSGTIIYHKKLKSYW